MPTPPLIEETDQTGIATVPFGGGRRDLEFIIRTNYEQFIKLFPRVSLYKLDREVSRPDPLYREKVHKTYSDIPIPVNAFFVFHPPDKLLKNFGIEVEHDALVVLNDRQLNLLDAKIVKGDLIEYLGINYETLVVKLVDYFLNTQVPLNSLAVVRQLAAR
jgi:hypothetical protein